MALKLRMFALVSCFLLLIGCSPDAESPSQQAPVRRIVYGLTLVPSGIDPHINQSSELGIVLRQVYDTLVYRDPETNEFLPGLALQWTISEDGLIYTFTLRQDVTFHDGTPFNAEAVAANLDRIVSPDTNSQRARFLLGPYQRYELVDSYTIRLILTEPYSPLLDSLSQVYLGIASPKALSENSLLTYQFHQVGTGPFVFVDDTYIPGKTILIRRNPDYKWGPAFYQTNLVNPVEEIEFQFFTDAATRAIALENGDAHIMGELLPLDARALTGNSAFVVVPVPIPGQPLQFYLNTLIPPTDDIRMRRALIYATNRSAIADSVYQGFSPIAWGPLAASSQFYTRAVVGTYGYDSAQSKSLLDSLGYIDTDSDGIVELNGAPLEINLIVPSWGLVPEVAQLIQEQWRSVGIRAVLEPVPGFNALIEKVQQGNYHLVSFDTFGLDPSLLNERYLSNGAVNWTGYGAIELDNILRESARISDAAVRRSLYGQAQAQIMEQALILPIRDYVNLNAYSIELEGLQFDPYGWFPLLHNLRYRQQ